jgi:hypothetical protein
MARRDEPNVHDGVEAVLLGAGVALPAAAWVPRSCKHPFLATSGVHKPDITPAMFNLCWEGSSSGEMGRVTVVSCDGTHSPPLRGEGSLSERADTTASVAVIENHNGAGPNHLTCRGVADDSVRR